MANAHSNAESLPTGSGGAEPIEPRFIVDLNVGRLAKRLRMMGYDAVFINGLDDDELIRIALRESRILLTKDHGIMRRRIVSSGKVKALLIPEGDIRKQLRQVIKAFNLESQSRPFSRCLECNEPLHMRAKENIRDLVPPYVFSTQDSYKQCPKCGRVYWRGTHWERMHRELQGMRKSPE